MLKTRLAIVAVCAALAGCGNPAQAVHLHAGSAEMTASVSPAVAGEANTIEIHSDEVPVRAIALDMPDMHMPAKPYALAERGKHLYEAANVSFSMAGTWRVRLLNSGGGQIASFTVAVR